MKSSNITWLDPNTGQAVCTLDGCRKKFKEKVIEKAVLTIVNGDKVMYDVYQSKCGECGRKHSMSTDRQKTQRSKSEAEKSLIFLKELG